MQMVLVDYPRMQKPALWMGMPHRSTGLREDLSLLGSATASPDLSNYSGIYINLSTCKLFFFNFYKIDPSTQVIVFLMICILNPRIVAYTYSAI